MVQIGQGVETVDTLAALAGTRRSDLGRLPTACPCQRNLKTQNIPHTTQPRNAVQCSMKLQKKIAEDLRSFVKKIKKQKKK